MIGKDTNKSQSQADLQRSNDGQAQLALELPVEAAISRADLLESASNQMAVSLIDNWPDWPSANVVLAGPVGSGKSHIAAVWAANAGAAIVTIDELRTDQRAAENVSLVIEDISPETIDEEVLFHAFNQARGAGNNLLLTARTFPSAWNLTLPDLASRIRHCHLVELQEPDDALLTAIIVKLFADRQLEIDPKLVNQLVGKMERSMEVATRLVEWLDREALARGGKINRKLVSEAISFFDGGE